MTTTGVVLSVDVERYGDTLTATTTALDLVISVDDVVDFADEDDFAAGPQWLTVGDSAPMQYVSVDDDANTVTLAAAVGAIYEAGEPVRMWDDAAGEEVVSGLCWIELDEAEPDDQPVPAEVRPEEMIHFGIDNLEGLVGARVEIAPDEDDPGTWHVAHIFGRTAKIDSGYITTPRASGVMLSNASIPTGTWTTVGYTIFALTDMTYDAATKKFRVEQAGTYSVVAANGFADAAGGQRSAKIVYDTIVGTVEAPPSRYAPVPAGDGRSSAPIVWNKLLQVGDLISVQVRQTSGGSIDLWANETALTITRVSN